MPLILIILLLLLQHSQSHPNPCTTTTTSTPLSHLTTNPNKLTLLISGYSPTRIPLLLSLTRAYTHSPYISSILILWSNPSTPLPLLHSLSSNLSSLSTPTTSITLLPQQSPSLNSRFLPRSLIRTRGVIIADDDVEIDPKSVEFAFKIWRENPDRLIGLFARSHDLDLISRDWIYTVHPERYSLVLTKFMVLHVDYFYLYTCGSRDSNINLSYDVVKELREVVDKAHNCEDILMNFLVADVSKRGPLLVGASGVRDYGDARNDDVEGVGVEKEGLSGVKRGRGEHRKRRGECIRLFHQVLGRMPLRFSYGKVISDDVGEQGLCEKSGRLVPCDQQVF